MVREGWGRRGHVRARVAVLLTPAITYRTRLDGEVDITNILRIRKLLPMRMTALTLHFHPLSSYCHKVLIALDELGIQAERRLLNLGDAEQRSAFLALWPTGKMPLLIDQGRAIPETSIIIEYLQRKHADPGRALIPNEPDEALEVRLWDRLFDLYVMTPMQAFTADLLRPEADRDALSVARAREGLSSAYAMIDSHLEGRHWVAGRTFSMADCAAAPALFYAVTYVPIAQEHERLAAYFERLLERPSVARTIDEARPYFKFYPGRQGLSRRFFDPDAA
jgi:glutathione S-transferase